MVKTFHNHFMVGLEEKSDDHEPHQLLTGTINADGTLLDNLSKAP